MNIAYYEKNLKHGRTLGIAGIFMLFEKVNYALICGISMIIIGLCIIIHSNKMISFEKKKAEIIKFIEETFTQINNNKKQIKEVKEPKIKEIKVIDVFGRKYEYNNKLINIKNIDKIIYYDINYDNMTLFLDIFIFIKKFTIIRNLKLNWNNKLLIDYYNHYYCVISYISNLNEVNDISSAISYLVEDYENNCKILDKVINDVLIEKNKLDWLKEKPTDPQYIIKYISTIFNYIISDNLNDKFMNLK